MRKIRRQKRRASASTLASGRLRRARQGLVHDRARALRRVGRPAELTVSSTARRAIRSRCRGRCGTPRLRPLATPAPARRSPTAQRPALESRQAPSPRSCVTKVAGQFASHLGLHCFILRGPWTHPYKLLPGQALSSSGRPRLDYRAVATLAFPFMLNSAVQAVLNATDTWFIGRLSPAATAAIGAVYWPVLVFVLLFGGVGLSVQTLVAQAYGARRYARASQATWTALWASLLHPRYSLCWPHPARRCSRPSAFRTETLQLALEYWYPRMLGGSLAIALWSLLGFFNGIGRPTVTLRIAVGVAVANAMFNQLFMFDFGMGDCGLGAGRPMSPSSRRGRGVRDFWAARREGATARISPRDCAARALLRQLKLGFPMGLLIAADILGFALFQLMQVRLGTIDGAATQIVMMLTSFCYMPAVGIAMAGTTLVGPGDRRAPPRLGVQGGQRHHPDGGALHGSDRRAACRRRALGIAVFHQRAHPDAAGVVARAVSVALDSRRISIVRRAQHQRRRMPARRRRCAPSGHHGPRPVVAAVRAPRA